MGTLATKVHNRATSANALGSSRLLRACSRAKLNGKSWVKISRSLSLTLGTSMALCEPAKSSLVNCCYPMPSIPIHIGCHCTHCSGCRDIGWLCCRVTLYTLDVHYLLSSGTKGVLGDLPHKMSCPCLIAVCLQSLPMETLVLTSEERCFQWAICFHFLQFQT